jgi:hypothetical protein
VSFLVGSFLEKKNETKERTESGHVGRGKSRARLAFLSPTVLALPQIDGVKVVLFISVMDIL